MSAPTALTKLLAIRHPVLLAPMAGVSGGLLATAVSRAGGLGFLGGGYGDSQWLAHELALCDGAPFGVGFITWALQAQPGLLRQALNAKPQAVFLSFGAIDRLAAQVRDGGAVLVAQVQTVRQAYEAVAQGAQVIVAQGGEAGGHGGLRGTMALVPAMGDYQVAQLAGDFDTAATIAGEAADMVRSIEPAAKIVQSMVDQCKALLQRAS